MPTVAEINAPTFKVPSLTADVVVFTRLRHEDIELWKGWQAEYPECRGPDPTEPGLYVMLIGRLNPPFRYEEGFHCTPGGFNNYGEDPKLAATRELQEETCLPKKDLPKLKLVGVYGSPRRDPRRHIVTLAWTCTISAKLARQARGADDAKFVVWRRMSEVMENTIKFGFDHRQIVLDALRVQ